MERRVVITGCSALTPIGCTREEIIESLLTGTSGIKKMQDDGLLTPLLHCGVFGSVDYPQPSDFKRQYRKTMGPVSFSACQAAKNIFDTAGLDPDFITSGRLGVAFGSTHGSPAVQRKIYQTLLQDNGVSDSGPQGASPAIGAVDYLKSMTHTTAVNITKMFGITGRVISLPSACTTSSQSIGFGYEMIKYGTQDAMLCGGADEYDTFTVAVFDNLMACSTGYNETPHLTPRPFDMERDGLVVGEGAGALLLEEYEFAKNRGADILAEIIGFSCSNNGGSLILPDLEGVVRTLTTGLENAQINPERVDFISAHATATKMGDVIEARAIHQVYGDNTPVVTGLKSYLGHTIGACGAIETILTIYMMNEGFIAPTLNLTDIDARCAMIRHAQELTESKINVAAIQNFAFGGINTCLFIKKVDLCN